MHAPSASRNSIQSGCHAPNLNPGALSRLARSVPEAHALLNGLAAGEVTLAIGENYYPPSLLLSTPEASPDRDAGAAGVGRQSVWLRSIATAASALIRYSSAVWIATGFSCLTGC